MIEKITHIKNPLTVIGAFAGLAEVSGTIVLPFLEKDIQYTFVWFLMLFPTALVLLFFATLIFRHFVLYAPSDYDDPNSFERIFQQSNRQIIIEKIAENAREDQDEPEDAPEPDGGQPPYPKPEIAVQNHDVTPPRASGGPETPFVAEKLLIAKLAEDRGLSFAESVSPSTMPDIGFDAVAVSKAGITIVEAKYYRKSGPSLQTARRDLLRVTKFLASLEQRPRSLTFVWAIAVDFPIDDPRVHNIRRTLNRAAANMPFKVEIEIYDFDKLARH